MIVFFELNLALFPETGSMTIKIILSGTLKGLASDFLMLFLQIPQKLVRAALDPVSNFPNGSGLSIPT